MITVIKFPTSAQLVSAGFDAINYGIEADPLGAQHLMLTGHELKSSKIAAKWGGTIISIKDSVSRS